MSTQAEKTQADKVNNGALLTLSAVGAAALVAIYLGVTALVRHQASIIGQERYAAADEDVLKLKDDQRKKLHAPPHRDPKKGTIAVPIELAMGAVVSDLQRDPRTATAYMPLDAGVADAAALADDAGAAAGDAGAEPAPTEGVAPEGQPAPEQPKPEEAPVEEKKPEEPKKKPKPGGATLGGVVAPRQPPAPQPAAPAPAPAPAPAEDSPY